MYLTLQKPKNPKNPKSGGPMARMAPWSFSSPRLLSACFPPLPVLGRSGPRPSLVFCPHNFHDQSSCPSPTFRTLRSNLILTSSLIQWLKNKWISPKLDVDDVMDHPVYSSGCVHTADGASSDQSTWSATSGPVGYPNPNFPTLTFSICTTLLHHLKLHYTSPAASRCSCSCVRCES